MLCAYRWDAKIAQSGGENDVWRCASFIKKPDMLLDEPTNHLMQNQSPGERFLHDYEGTVVAITHDRYFLDNVAGWISTRSR